MAIKKRRPAGDEIPRGSNHGGIKKRAVPNEKPTGDKDYQDGGGNERDAFERALDKANENKRRVKEVQMGDRKAQPKLEAGKYIAITTDAKPERNIESKYGVNDRVEISFEVFIDEDFQESILLTEKLWASGSEDSKYCQILSELLQFDARMGFRLKDVIGVTCEVTIVHNRTHQGIFSNVAGVEVISIEENESMEGMQND